MMSRRCLLMAGVGLGLLLKVPAATATAGWPAWEQFAAGYIRDDGRVVDWTDHARSTSEGQSYALFFALVAGDRLRFEQVLVWSRANLAGGDLKTSLPAWHWGQTGETSWGVVDPNSASDADLWIAYALLQAGRLWKRDDYSAEAHALLGLVEAQEVCRAGPLTLLLPGHTGFETEAGIRLNPSYLPPFLLRQLIAVRPRGPWQAVLNSYLKLLPALTPGGRIPDWYLLTAEGPRLDVSSDGRGGYDAIRNYLWAGFGAESVPEAHALLMALKPYLALLRGVGRTPETWYPDGRAPAGIGPPGFDAALLPFLTAAGADDLAAEARARLASARIGDLLGSPARYYDQVLALFGEGHDQKRFRFGQDGRLELP
ncbi:MAG: cellulose synthase complex periplasmic endoglucanase BcsZ [Nevskia sp.]|nr:cellulose synthase complex periplasmic endoglucanase BcsZ [Nevskia sp.]